MNNKQRTLLCRMLEEKAVVLRKEISNHFKSNYLVLSKHYLTDVDDRIHPCVRKRWGALTKRYKALEKEAEVLAQENNKVMDKISSVRSAAIELVNLKLRDMILKIHFVDCLEEAQSLLSGFPSITTILKEAGQ